MTEQKLTRTGTLFCYFDRYDLPLMGYVILNEEDGI